MNDVVLRSLNESDLEMVRMWRNLPEVNKYMYTDANITTSQQINWYKTIIADKTVKYWIIEYETKPVGLVSINSISQVFDSCSWAFYLGDTTIRGAGIGAKVEYNVLSYVFDELGINKLYCEVMVFNDQVIKMHEKFGFRREAYYREHVKKNDIFYDVVGLALLRSEWMQLKDFHFNRIYKI